MEKGNWSNLSNITFTLAQMTDVSLSGRILLGTISSAVCLLVITLLLLLLVFYKAYTSTLQRLLLYLTIMVVIQEACLTVGYSAAQFEYNDQETFCNIISIITTWSATASYLSTFGIFIYLPYKFYKQIRGDPFPRQLRSKCCHVALEFFFVLVVLALTLMYIWWTWDNCIIFAPWQWCSWVITNENCTFSGPDQDMEMLMLFFISYDLMGGIGVVFTIVPTVVFCCVACKYRETRQPFLKTLCRTLILLGLFVASTTVTLLVNIILLLPSKLVYADDWYIYPLVNAAVLPVIQMVFPLGFLFYLYSFNLCRWRAIKRAAAEWRCFRSCCGRENELRVDQIREAATAPRSHCVTAPSVTFFDIPLTGAFTDVTTEEQQALSPDGNGGGTGYGGVVNAV